MPAAGDLDVAYVAVLADVSEPSGSDGETILNYAGVLSLVRRLSRGGWLVHAFGDYVPPEQMPKDR